MKYLSKMTLFVCTTFLMCLSGHIFAKDAELDKNDRNYINPKSLKIDDNGLSLVQNGKKKRVKALYSDKEGKLYTAKWKNKSKGKVKKSYCKKHGWDFLGCSRCEREKKENEKREREHRDRQERGR